MCGRYTLYTAQRVSKSRTPSSTFLLLGATLQHRPLAVDPRGSAASPKARGGGSPLGFGPRGRIHVKIGYKMINAKRGKQLPRSLHFARRSSCECSVFWPMASASTGKPWGRPRFPTGFTAKTESPSRWRGFGRPCQKEEQTIESCTIITTTNQVLQPFHDRMPVILDPKDHSLWLDPKAKDVNLLKELL